MNAKQQQKMEVQQVLHMKGGDDDSSYAKNSSLQKVINGKVKHILDQRIQEFCQSKVPAKCINVADLGCASGPNTVLTIQEIIECIDKEYNSLNIELPSIQIFLNDLESNDFNSIFKSLPFFYEQVEKRGRHLGTFFVAAMPGSFYGRLFPESSIHFVHSSNSLHWLSQAPKGLVTETRLPLNKGNIYIAKTSLPEVHVAYLDQFAKDFTDFLRMRSVEMVPDGQVFLTLHSSTHGNGGYSYQEILGMTFNDMVMEGLIEETTLDDFNLPMYEPSMEEVSNIIDDEGSFKVKQVETIEMLNAEMVDKLKLSVFDRQSLGEYTARSTRAVFETILARQFGDGIMDDLFCRFGRKISEYIGRMKSSNCVLVISLTKN